MTDQLPPPPARRPTPPDGIDPYHLAPLHAIDRGIREAGTVPLAVHYQVLERHAEGLRSIIRRHGGEGRGATYAALLLELDQLLHRLG